MTLLHIITVLLLVIEQIDGFSPTRFRGFVKSCSALNLFDFFKGSDRRNDPVTTAGPVTTKGKASTSNYKLEKISNTQKRDWKKESAELEANKKPEEVRDKQFQAYNFKKSNEFPNLYEGWIAKDGDQIGKQMVNSVKAAIGKKQMYQEVLFDPVPNLDEVAFGTVWNKRLRMEVAVNLKVPDYACNRGGPSTLEWSNLYWLNRLAQGVGKKVLAISISGEGTGKAKFVPTLAKGVTLVTLAEAKKMIPELTKKQYDLVVMISPCSKTHYETLKKIGDSMDAFCIALNSPYSFNYDIGGGKPFELVYLMKRIPKGASIPLFFYSIRSFLSLISSLYSS
jgi:hypothetical protein